MARRVVITGIGLVTPVGNGTWTRLLGRPGAPARVGAGPITRFDASRVRDPLRLRGQGLRPVAAARQARAKHLDRFLHFAIGAGRMAMEDAGFPDRKVPAGEEERWGVYVGAGLGGLSSRSRRPTWRWREKGPRHGFSPYFVADIIINMAPGLLSIKHGRRGPNMSHVSGLLDRGALDRRGRAGHPTRRRRRHDRRRRRVDRHAARASAASAGARAVSRATTSRPRRADRSTRSRDGFVHRRGRRRARARGARTAPQARGARIYAELVGYGANADAYHITLPAPEATGRRALHADRAARTPGWRPSRSATSTRTGPRPGQRRERDHRDQGRCSASTPTRASRSARPSRCPGTCSGPPAGSRPAISALALRDGGAAADHQPRRPRSRSATSTTCPTEARELAVEDAMSQQLRLRRDQRGAPPAPSRRDADPCGCYFGSDHAGGRAAPAPGRGRARARRRGRQRRGAHRGRESVDYPDFAAVACAKRARRRSRGFGLLVCGTGHRHRDRGQQGPRHPRRGGRRRVHRRDGAARTTTPTCSASGGRVVAIGLAERRSALPRAVRASTERRAPSSTPGGSQARRAALRARHALPGLPESRHQGARLARRSRRDLDPPPADVRAAAATASPPSSASRRPCRW